MKNRSLFFLLGCFWFCACQKTVQTQQIQKAWDRATDSLQALCPCPNGGYRFSVSRYLRKHSLRNGVVDKVVWTPGRWIIEEIITYKYRFHKKPSELQVYDALIYQEGKAVAYRFSRYGGDFALQSNATDEEWGLGFALPSGGFQWTSTWNKRTGLDLCNGWPRSVYVGIALVITPDTVLIEGTDLHYNY